MKWLSKTRLTQGGLNKVLLGLGIYWALIGGWSVAHVATSDHLSPYRMTVGIVEMIGGPLYGLLLTDQLKSRRYLKREIELAKRSVTAHKELSDKLMSLCDRTVMNGEMVTADEVMIMMRALAREHPPIYEEAP